jgi:outer membrane immunogenic protein
VKGAPPPYIAPIYDWTGFYFGGHGGYGLFQGSQNDFAGLAADNNLDGQGWLGGGQFGYNWQLASWVFGLEFDFSYTDIRGTGTNPVIPILEQTVRINWYGSAAARVGLAWDRTLVYAKGGIAYGDVRSETLIVPLLLLVGNDQRTGWTAGVGAEWAFFHNWTAKVEYDYLDLGTRTVTLTSPITGVSVTASSEATAHLIKLGANYRFSWR